jgi:pimeloyl-ACP methyl ester carboxylesterase
MDSSAGWILNSVEKCFAYKLADAGYDVWLGNARGNKYSKRHVSMTDKDKEFWNFSWNEMGKYDVPAVLNYILDKTGEEKIFYVGHSMGSTMFIIAMSEHPELNDKIRLMVGVGPAIYVHNMVSPIRLLAPFWDSIDWITNMMGMHEFLPSGPLMDFLGATLCKESSLFQPICSNILFIAMGYNFDQLNATMLPIILGHAPAGASTNSVIHYAQSVRHQDFRKWDFGKKGNLEVYGVDPPPQYDLSKVTAPVAIYWGQNDWLVQEPDVYRFANAMPNLVKIQRVNHDKWNHVDFVWGIDADTLLYNPIMEFMKRF